MLSSIYYVSVYYIKVVLVLNLKDHTPSSLDSVDVPSKFPLNEDGTSTGMKKDQTTQDVCFDIHDNHEMDSIENEDQVSKSMARPSSSQGSSIEHMSGKSALNSRCSETSPPTKEYSSYRYPYKTTFNCKKSSGKKIPVLSSIIGMRFTKEISVVVSFIGLLMLILYCLKSPPKYSTGNKSENTV